MRVNPALRFFQSQVAPDGCYVIVDCGSSSTKVLIETKKGSKVFSEDGDALARIDCVLNWDETACSKASDPSVKTRNKKTSAEFKTAILTQINARKPADCQKFYVALFATGGMRQNVDGIVRAQNAEDVKAIAQSFVAMSNSTNILAGKILGSKGAAIKGSVEGLFAIRTALSFHSKLQNTLGKGQNVPLGACDLGGQTNQWAWEKKSACNYALKNPITVATEAPSDAKAEFGTSRDDYPIGSKTQCSQSAMWGLNAFGKDKTAGFTAHQRNMMTNIPNGTQPDNMLVYGIGNYWAIWKTCMAQAPCKKKFFDDTVQAGGFGLSSQEESNIKFIKNCKVKHYKEMMDWWDTNVSEKTDAATFRPGITAQMIPPFGNGNSRLASHNYDTLHTMQNLSDDQDIVPVKAAWNEGATIHMDNKGENEPVVHAGAGAGGDDEGFDSWFNEIATTLGGSETRAGGDNDPKDKTGAGGDNDPKDKTGAGGDNDPKDEHPGTVGTGSSSNLRDRVDALEAKLLALETQKAGRDQGPGPQGKRNVMIGL